MRQKLAESVRVAGETGYFHLVNRCERAKNVCVFGLGRYFEEAFAQWKFKENLGVNVLCDNNPEKWGRTVKGIRVVSPDELYALEDLIVLPLVGDRISIYTQLLKKRIKCFDFEHYTFELMAGTPRNPEWFAQNRILDVYDMLADEQSKNIYAKTILNRIDGFQYFYSDFITDDEYFPDLYTLNSDEVFVDCGAYTGDTLSRFVKRTSPRGKGAMHEFEVDSQNYTRLEETVRSLRVREKVDNIYCHHAAVWNESGVLSLGREEHGDLMGVSVMKTGNDFITQTVPAVTIDDTAGNATFIKMDIEGAELNALKGAEKTIRKMRPKLAICLYHRLRDFWEIPAYLREITPEYRLYVRHHEMNIGGTVLYATCDGV